MKKLVIILSMLSLIAFNSCYAQSVSIKNNRVESMNTKAFVGKPLKNLLNDIRGSIKSIIPTPNKNKNEVYSISFLLVDYSEYRRLNDIEKSKVKISVFFNQNGDLKGDRCRYNIKGCTEWTKEDEENLGDLIVYDIYVLGKD